MKYMLLTLFCLLLAFFSSAQKIAFPEEEYAQKPLWINMINDTLANYFEVEKAYSLYWQHHKMPVSEDEFEGKRNKDKNEDDEPATLEEMREKNAMGAAIRAYKIWHMQMLPYVQDDGRILTPAEQIAAWRNQQQQSKQQVKN